MTNPTTNGNQDAGVLVTIEKLENRLWKYRKRVCAVIEFNKELEKE